MAQYIVQPEADRFRGHVCNGLWNKLALMQINLAYLELLLQFKVHSLSTEFHEAENHIDTARMKIHTHPSKISRSLAQGFISSGPMDYF